MQKHFLTLSASPFYPPSSLAASKIAYYCHANNAYFINKLKYPKMVDFGEVDDFIELRIYFGLTWPAVLSAVALAKEEGRRRKL